MHPALDIYIYGYIPFSVATCHLILVLRHAGATISQKGEIMKKARTFSGMIALVCLLTPLGVNAQVEQLYGTWRLVNWTRQVVGTHERTEIFGNAPHGFLNYGRDGRMSVIIVRANRAKPPDLAKLTDQDRAELFKSMTAYGGTFKVDGSRVVHNVDISSNENWSGTTQVRNFRIDGRTLTITTDPISSPVDGKQNVAELTWEKLQ
jgi:hypothetical protein